MAIDLSLTKSATAADPLFVGSMITYTLTASNINTGDATGVVVTDSLPSQAVSKGYVFEDNHLLPEPNWKKTNILGAGGIYSTSSDLLKWINASNSAGFLSSKDRVLIKSPISYYEHYDSDFGYSWAKNKTTFKTKDSIYFYGGTSLGFYSIMVSVPSKGINIILLNNTGNFHRME